MKIPLLGKFKDVLRAPTPAGVLALAGWALTFLLLASLVADGLIFYRYGLGAAPETGGASEATKLNAALIEDAARHVGERRAKLEEVLAAPLGLPDVFLPPLEPPAGGGGAFNAESQQ